MEKNGFVFVETIVAVVVLTAALLLIYTSFNKILQTEKTRVYYDDIAYIYRSQYIKKSFDNLNILALLNDIDSNPENYFVTVGVQYERLFEGYEQEKDYINSLLMNYDVNQIIVLKENKVDNLKNCMLKDINTLEELDKKNCNNLKANTSDEFQSYIRNIFIDIPCTYVMLVEYNTCTSEDGNSNCKKYYSWVSV